MNNQATIDTEFNLMPYVVGVLRRWHWIVLAALLGAMVAAGLTLAQPRYYRATATLLFTGDRSQLSLDPRLTTREFALSDLSSRRVALLALAYSPNVEAYIPEDVLAEVAPPDHRPGTLVGQIEAAQTGDLIEIHARAATPQMAQALATAWAQAYAYYVNVEVSGADDGALAVTEQQVADARATYEAAQEAYAAYVGSNRLDEVNDQINSLVALLNGNLRTTINLYQFQVTQAQNLSLILQDARILRDQVAAGQAPSAGERLTTLLLRLRAVGPVLSTSGTDETGEIITPPAQPLFQVQLAPDTAPLTDAEVLRELDQFIAQLEGQLDAVRGNLEALEETLATNTPMSQGPLTAEQQQSYYDQLLALRAERERIQGEDAARLQARDIALEKLQVVERKLAEQQVAETEAEAEVRFVSEALLPYAPASRGTVTRTFVGGVTGAVLGTFLALLATLLPPNRLLGRRSRLGQPADRPSYG